MQVATISGSHLESVKLVPINFWTALDEWEGKERSREIMIGAGRGKRKKQNSETRVGRLILDGLFRFAPAAILHHGNSF